MNENPVGKLGNSSTDLKLIPDRRKQRKIFMQLKVMKIKLSLPFRAATKQTHCTPADVSSVLFRDAPQFNATIN